MTFSIFMHIFVLALLGLVFLNHNQKLVLLNVYKIVTIIRLTNMILFRPVIDQNLYYIGLKLTSPTFSSAVSNIVPAITFILATLFRYIHMHDAYIDT